MIHRICSLSIAGVLFALVGCASMQEAYRREVCNEHGGYQHGMNDARAGKPMDQSFAQTCDELSREAALTGYRNGYNDGLGSLSAGKPSTEINVNIGGGARSVKKAYCEIHAFTETFAAWGSTELEARVNAKQKCTARFNEMHCDDISCKSS